MRSGRLLVALGLGGYTLLLGVYLLLGLVTEHIDYVGRPDTLALWTPLVALMYLVLALALRYDALGRGAVGGLLVMPWLAYATSSVGEVGALLYYVPAALPALALLATSRDGREPSTTTTVLVETSDGVRVGRRGEAIVVDLPGGELHRRIVSAITDALPNGRTVEILDSTTDHVFAIAPGPEEVARMLAPTSAKLWVTSPASPLLVALVASTYEPHPRPVRLCLSAGS